MRVLFIDDDYDDYLIFCEALHDINPEARCQYKENGADALTFLEEHLHSLPDYIFLDIHMPVMDGVECLEKIKMDEHLKQIPVILFSSSVNPRDRDKYKRLGAEEFIIKPSRFQDIVELFKSLGKKLSCTILPGMVACL